MNPEDFDRFTVFMSVVQETFSPDKPVSKQRTKIYFEALKDIPIENIELGVKELMRKKRYPIFPLPREIREAAGFNEDDDLDLKALEAFREADSLISHIINEKAMGEKSQADDPLIEETVRLCFGGWESFANTDRKNDNWDKKQFVEIYKKLFQTDQRDKLLSEADVMKQLKENREEIKTLEERKSK